MLDYEEKDVIIGAVLGSAVLALCTLVLVLFVMVCNLKKKVKHLLQVSSNNFNSHQPGGLSYPQGGNGRPQVLRPDELTNRGFKEYQGQGPAPRVPPQQPVEAYNDRYTSATSPGYNNRPTSFNGNFSYGANNNAGPRSPQQAGQQGYNGNQGGGFSSQQPGGPYNQQAGPAGGYNNNNQRGVYTNQGFQGNAPQQQQQQQQQGGSFLHKVDKYSNRVETAAGFVGDVAGYAENFGGDFGDVAGTVGDVAGNVGDLAGNMGEMGELAGGVGKMAGGLKGFGGKGKKGKFGF